MEDNKTGAPKPNPDKGQNAFRTNIFKTVKNISDKFSAMLGNDAQNLKEVRKQTRDLSLQVKLTKKTLKENRFRFDKIAESNVAVADALKEYDSVNFGVIESVEQLLAQNKEIPAELGAQYKEAFEKFNNSLKPLQDQQGIEINLGSVMDEVAKIVADRSVAPETRKSFVTDFIKLLEKQEGKTAEQTQLLGFLVDEAKRGLTLNDSQTDDIGAIFELLKTYKVDDLKTTSTINAINLTAGKLLMSSRNIEDELEQSQFSVKDLLDKLEKGLGADGMDIGDLIFAALGLPGLLATVTKLKDFGSRVGNFLKDIFGKEGSIVKFAEKISKGWNKQVAKLKNVFNIFNKSGPIGKVISRVGAFASRIGSVFKTIGGFFSGITKAFKPIMKVLKVGGAIAGGTFLAPVVAIIGVIMGIFDAVSGFFNAAEISGKKEEMLTLGDKIQASISSFLSGLSFGFISAETIFKKIDEAQAFIGEIWDDTTKVFTDFVDAITEFFLGEDGIFGTLRGLTDKFKDFKFSNLVPSFISNAFSDEESTEKPEENSGRFAKTPVKSQAVLGSLQTARSTYVASEDKMASEQAAQAFRREETVRNTNTAKAAQVIPVPMAQPQAAPLRPALKKAQIDDMQLSAINVGLMD